MRFFSSSCCNLLSRGTNWSHKYCCVSCALQVDFLKWQCEDFWSISSCILNSYFNCSIIQTGFWHWTSNEDKNLGISNWVQIALWTHWKGSLFNIICSGMRIRWSDFAKKTVSLCTQVSLWLILNKCEAWITESQNFRIVCLRSVLSRSSSTPPLLKENHLQLVV